MGFGRASTRCDKPAPTPLTDYTAVVVGGGPAGAIAATCLARQGLKVAVIDPGRDGPVIGETLPAAAVDMLTRHGLPGPLNDPSHVAISGTVTAWDGPTVTESALNKPGGTDWRLDRKAFDAALVEAAQDAGAKLVRNTVRSVRQHKKRWDLSTDETKLTTELVVDATGRRCLIGRSLGLQRHRQDRQIAVWAIGSTLAEPRTSKTLIQADDDGWWYGAILPSGRPIAAYHCAMDRALEIRRNPAEWHASLIRADILSNRMHQDTFAAVVLQFNDASGSAIVPPAGDGWVACGDAAIAFDPIAAQGLLNAVRTGLAAAETLTGGDEAQARYCTELRDVWARYLARHQVLKARLNVSRATT